MTAAADYIVAPFTILIDSREQHPFSFTGIIGDSHDRYREIVVPTKWQGLPTGDYSIEGCEGLVAVERKNRLDLFSTIIGERERFLRELERLAAMQFAAVVVEESFGACLRNPPEFGTMPGQHKAKVVGRSVLAWQQRYPNTHWIFCDDRRLAEITTYRILDRFWKDRSDAQQTATRSALLEVCEKD